MTLDPGLGGSTLVNTASLASAPPAARPRTPIPTNNSSSISQPVASRSDIALLKQITSGPIVAGAQVTYLISAGNRGPSTARNLVLSDPVPAGTTLVSATASADGTCQPAATVTCSWPLVPPGPAGDPAATRTVTIVVAVPSGAAVGSIVTNTASIRSDSFDNNPVTASSTASAPVTAAADLSATKTVLSGSPVAGGQVRWQVVVSNAGPSDADRGRAGRQPTGRGHLHREQHRDRDLRDRLRQVPAPCTATSAPCRRAAPSRSRWTAPWPLTCPPAP